MKKFLFSIFLTIICFTFLANDINAASGKAYIYYLDDNREMTYTLGSRHLNSMGYNVYGKKNSTSANAFLALQDSSVFVAHDHGSPGSQMIGESSQAIVAIGGPNASFSVSKKMSNWYGLKIAILYGCDTGRVVAGFGDLPGELVKKGATTAVAWKVTTYWQEVNDWNGNFFEKAKTDNVVESYRHADYWLRYFSGDVAGDRMQLNRNEKGNINISIN